jgi:hypothetical protein
MTDEDESGDVWARKSCGWFKEMKKDAGEEERIFTTFSSKYDMLEYVS